MIYSINDHQSNEWKLAVYKAVKEDNVTKNNIAQKIIRPEDAKKGWNGKTNNRQFQRIKSYANRAVQSLGNTSQFRYLSYIK